MKLLTTILLAFIGLMSNNESDKTPENEKNPGLIKNKEVVCTANVNEIETHNYVNIIASIEKESTLCEVPKVSDKNLFNAIVRKYKGKIVIVDFWGTWCGPCILDIQFLEPLKETEIKNDNLVFVYITNESSPEEKWLSMIPDIKGDHYRLSNNQFKYITSKFGVRGFPSYVLVDKNGKSKLRNDLHSLVAIKKLLDEEFPE